jgi:lysophospholipase L1-like esterase
MIAPETPTQRLARSLFGYMLVLTIFAAVASAALLASPSSPDPGYAHLRTLIIGGVFAGTALIAGVVTWLFRASPDQLYAPAQFLARLLGSGRTALVVLFVVLQLNLGLHFVLMDIAPAVVGPLRLIFAGASLVLFTIVLTLHYERFRRALAASSQVWAGIGVVVTVMTILAISVTATGALVQRSGINDRLRGGLDYRALTFIDDGASPSSSAFWQEQSQTRVRWEPYVYWVVDAFDGSYINVSSSGIRQTVNPPLHAEAPLLSFYGGSTAWGEGSRDRYTIPSQLSHLLAAAGTGYNVINYGQTGYVSTQDMLMFQLRLLQGERPAAAIFYGGFNDVLSAYYQPYSGIPLQEGDRISDAEAGRLLRVGQPVLRPLASMAAHKDFELVAASDVTPEAVVERYLANVRLIQQIAEANGIRAVFVWQPALAFKRNLVGGETTAYTRMTSERPGFAQYYQAVDDALGKATQRDNGYNILDLSHLFDGDERAIFYDLVHITEEGNQTVAQAIAAFLHSPRND